KAILLINQALKIKAQDPDKVSLARSYNNLSVIYLDSGQPGKALEAAAQAVQAAEASGDKGALAFFLEGYSSSLTENGQYPKALEVLERDLTLRQTLNNPSDIRAANRRIAGVYLRMGDNVRAVAIFEKLVEAYQSGDDKPGLATASNGVASA